MCATTRDHTTIKYCIIHTLLQTLTMSAQSQLNKQRYLKTNTNTTNFSSKPITKALYLTGPPGSNAPSIKLPVHRGSNVPSIKLPVHLGSNVPSIKLPRPLKYAYLIDTEIETRAFVRYTIMFHFKAP